MIRVYSAVKNLVDFDLELWIAGTWDDILLPYMGRMGAPGTYYANFLSGVNEEELIGVKFLGNLNSNDLQENYLMADYFLSLSTYNDEDYGMSPAEAGCSGLPLILSRWGGYISFEKMHKDISFLPLAYNANRVQVDSTVAIKNTFSALIKLLAKPANRFENAKTAHEQFSIEGLAKKMKTEFNELIFSPVDSFAPEFYQLCSLFKMNPLAPFKGRNEQYVDLYYQIYNFYGFKKDTTINH
jgi:glycosyltransferase involved in cell wall biosynthesis